jgi:hypothetical protein
VQEGDQVVALAAAEAGLEPDGGGVGKFGAGQPA